MYLSLLHVKDGEVSDESVLVKKNCEAEVLIARIGMRS